jgi:hypothetical protein
VVRQLPRRRLLQLRPARHDASGLFLSDQNSVPGAEAERRNRGSDLLNFGLLREELERLSSCVHARLLSKGLGATRRLEERSKCTDVSSFL